MQAIELLLKRTSYNQLVEPAPNGDVLANILQAGCCVPDHGGLTPWRFIVFKAQALVDLGEIYAEAAEQDGADCEKIEKAKNMPLRAPMVIAVIANIDENNKIPASEQLIAAGCAAHSIQMAAVAQGFQGIWRTGVFAYHPHIKQQLKLTAQEQIVGYIYLGTAKGDVPAKSRKNYQNFVQYW
ncbi:NAD(P)H nitroreductase [Catenovulum sediminis]|uniref:Putative NAD(P)H nitroreductase n=1 Tax=Catenovulum sediminis TaxID=1740262 RepID=A0ABV1RKQ5_9ALTE|nr:NAD(P)H nitroreductase [Catenovulum sediminis]